MKLMHLFSSFAIAGLVCFCLITARRVQGHGKAIWESQSTADRPASPAHDAGHAEAKAHSSSLISTDWREELIGLHKSIVEIESLTGNELKVGEWLEKYLVFKGFSVEMQKVEEGRYNVYAWGGTDDDKGKEELLLTSHIDTVPPFLPYHRDSNDTISGRGSVDAKASVASQIIAALSLIHESKIPRSSIGLLYVVGEETDAVGMRHFSESSLNMKNYTAVVFGEPTEQKLVAGHKGGVQLSVKVEGRASHSGYPWLGLSANDILIQALSIVKDMEAGKNGLGLPWDENRGNTTVNVGTMTGGVAANVVAASASAELLFRVAASTPDGIAQSVEEALKSVHDYAVENGGNFTLVRGGQGSLPQDLDCDIDGFECFFVNYGTDIPHLKLDESVKRYLYGPGSIFVAHGPNEALHVSELERAVLDYKKIISGILEKKNRT